MRFEVNQPKQNDANPANIFLGLLIVLILVFSFSVINAYVISSLWNWYVSTYFGIKEMTLPVAFGIGLIFAYFRGLPACKDERSLSEKIGSAIALPSFSITAGWIGTYFL